MSADTLYLLCCGLPAALLLVLVVWRAWRLEASPKDCD